MIPAVDELLSTDDVVERVGEGLSYATLHRWVAHGAVRPTIPPAGPGSRAGWTQDDVMMVEAVARVRADLHDLGLDCPHTLVRLLWDQLVDTGTTAGLHVRTVTISCHARPVPRG